MLTSEYSASVKSASTTLSEEHAARTRNPEETVNDARIH